MGYGVWGDETKTPPPPPPPQRLRALALHSTVCGQTRANRTGRSLRSPTLRVVLIYAFQPHHHLRLGISRCADRGVAVRTRVASALATGVGAGGCRGKEPIGGGFVLRRPTVLRCLAGLPALGTNTCECASVKSGYVRDCVGVHSGGAPAPSKRPSVQRLGRLGVSYGRFAWSTGWRLSTTWSASVSD